MNPITRYRQWCAETHRHQMLPDAQGDYVCYADYAALQAEMIAWKHTAESTDALKNEITTLEAQLAQAALDVSYVVISHAEMWRQDGDTRRVLAQIEAALAALKGGEAQ